MEMDTALPKFPSRHPTRSINADAIQFAPVDMKTTLPWPTMQSRLSLAAGVYDEYLND
jgi:hypothetical protein